RQSSYVTHGLPHIQAPPSTHSENLRRLPLVRPLARPRPQMAAPTLRHRRHLIPVSRPGGSNAGALVASCWGCHLSRATPGTKLHNAGNSPPGAVFPMVRPGPEGPRPVSKEIHESTNRSLFFRRPFFHDLDPGSLVEGCEARLLSASTLSDPPQMGAG